jgi:hypothetical protein
MKENIEFRLNAIAIGQPDKVSARERDSYGSIKSFGWSTVHRKKEKVIEFDLPKGYTARDAYYNGLYWVLSREMLKKPNKRWKYITMAELVDHFEDHSIGYDHLNNLFLLLAYANGFKE